MANTTYRKHTQVRQVLHLDHSSTGMHLTLRPTYPDTQGVHEQDIPWQQKFALYKYSAASIQPFNLAGWLLGQINLYCIGLHMYSVQRAVARVRSPCPEPSNSQYQQGGFSSQQRAYKGSEQARERDRWNGVGVTGPPRDRFYKFGLLSNVITGQLLISCHRRYAQLLLSEIKLECSCAICIRGVLNW